MLTLIQSNNFFVRGAANPIFTMRVAFIGPGDVDRLLDIVDAVWDEGSEPANKFDRELFGRVLRISRTVGGVEVGKFFWEAVTCAADNVGAGFALAAIGCVCLMRIHELTYIENASPADPTACSTSPTAAEEMKEDYKLQKQIWPQKLYTGTRHAQATLHFVMVAASFITSDQGSFWTFVVFMHAFQGSKQDFLLWHIANKNPNEFGKIVCHFMQEIESEKKTARSSHMVDFPTLKKRAMVIGLLCKRRKMIGGRVRSFADVLKKSAYFGLNMPSVYRRFIPTSGDYPGGVDVEAAVYVSPTNDVWAECLADSRSRNSEALPEERDLSDQVRDVIQMQNEYTLEVTEAMRTVWRPRPFTGELVSECIYFASNKHSQFGGYLFRNKPNCSCGSCLISDCNSANQDRKGESHELSEGHKLSVDLSKSAAGTHAESCSISSTSSPVSSSDSSPASAPSPTSSLASSGECSPAFSPIRSRAHAVPEESGEGVVLAKKKSKPRHRKKKPLPEISARGCSETCTRFPAQLESKLNEETAKVASLSETCVSLTNALALSEEKALAIEKELRAAEQSVKKLQQGRTRLLKTKTYLKNALGACEMDRNANGAQVEFFGNELKTARKLLSEQKTSAEAAEQDLLHIVDASGSRIRLLEEELLRSQKELVQQKNSAEAAKAGFDVQVVRSDKLLGCLVNKIAEYDTKLNSAQEALAASQLDNKRLLQMSTMAPKNEIKFDPASDNLQTLKRKLMTCSEILHELVVAQNEIQEEREQCSICYANYVGIGRVCEGCMACHWSGKNSE